MALTTIVLTVFVTLAVVVAGRYMYEHYVGHATPVVHIPPLHTETMVGSKKDKHGCCVDCGYEWCEAKQACVRPWETPDGLCQQTSKP